MKIIAMYFPQFHAIKENDEWWGKGFTDWHNVRKATSQFEGHYQPRIPLENNYYDQSLLNTLSWQINLAREYGIFGFCHYHYWFDGTHLLHKPTELMLENSDLDFPFCLSWANETWSRRWDGLDHHILIQQTHPPTIESWRKHFEYLLRAWKDPRAIKVDGKPVFVIYRPQRITKIDEMLTQWRSWAHEEGLPGLYFVFQKQYDLPDTACLKSFDAQFQFQPFEAIYSSSSKQKHWPTGWINSLLKQLPLSFRHQINRLLSTIKPTQLTFYDYDTVWKNVINSQPSNQKLTFPGAFIDWDNTPRYKNRATIFKGASPDRFHYWLNKLSDSMPSRGLPEDYIFLNAWNEWSEGTYLEPDQQHEYRYLEVIRSVLHGR